VEKNKTLVPTGPRVHSQQRSMAFLDSNANNRKVKYSSKKKNRRDHDKVQHDMVNEENVSLINLVHLCYPHNKVQHEMVNEECTFMLPLCVSIFSP